MVGVKHTPECSIGKGTADPWQADLTRTVIRRAKTTTTSGLAYDAVLYECPLCHRRAIRLEPRETT